MMLTELLTRVRVWRYRYIDIDIPRYN